MAGVNLRDVTKKYGRTEAVKGVSFDIADGELLVILGPSGCGKTSTLRMIAGLETVSSGSISFDGRPVTTVPPARRNVAMAFENYGLYEHWTVFDNIAYPLRLRGLDDGGVRRKVTAVAEQLQITDVLRTRPAGLSGGMRQRIGLARALVRDPSVFLLDEPMSHVDADLRNDLRAEIKRIHLEVGSTMIIVTHDQLDALTMADRILVMDDGRIEQLDTPAAVYDTPATTFVAGFIGEPPMNLLSARRADGGDVLTLDGGGRFAPPPSLLDAVPTGADVTVGFRPHRVRLEPTAARTTPAGDLGLDATVYMVEPLGDRTLVTVRCGDTRMKVDLPGTPEFTVDQPVRLTADRADVHVFDPTGRRIDRADTRRAAAA
ncbi:ABC transporter ATP-binding protein [Micromonospora sp. NBS 11-29]|uniref:ABC transporter ATP-binding protein n=1 Tax=Micromonospora sp. NBS 11-29 TaxID=1960879 RepID=UPI000B78D47A|nr:ABC transporter ATP-binding protein [Micromonospora sp. NBS 11-29]